jgi:hypothetical protein
MTDLEIDRMLAGAAGATTCSGAALERITDERDAFLRDPEVDARIDRIYRSVRRRRATRLGIGLAVAAAAAAVCLWVASSREPLPSVVAEVTPPVALSVRLELGTHARPLRPGETLRPGDLLRFDIAAPPGFIAVVAVDQRHNAAVVIVPVTAFEPGQAVVGVVGDEAVTYELYALFARRAFRVDDVGAALAGSTGLVVGGPVVVQTVEPLNVNSD